MVLPSWALAICPNLDHSMTAPVSQSSLLWPPHLLTATHVRVMTTCFFLQWGIRCLTALGLEHSCVLEVQKHKLDRGKPRAPGWQWFLTQLYDHMTPISTLRIHINQTLLWVWQLQRQDTVPAPKTLPVYWGTNHFNKYQTECDRAGRREILIWAKKRQALSPLFLSLHSLFLISSIAMVYIPSVHRWTPSRISSPDLTTKVQTRKTTAH